MIRFIVGLLVVFGAVGGIETATDAEIFPLIGAAALGLILMYFGTEKMKQM